MGDVELAFIFGGGDAELLLEDHGEVALSAETTEVGNFRDGIAPTHQKFGSAIEFVSAEEVGRSLARQSLDLIIEFSTRDVKHLRDTSHIEF